MRKISFTIFFITLLSLLFLGSYVLAAPSSNSQEALNQFNAAAGASGANIAGSGPTDPRIIIAVIIRASLAFMGIFFVVLIMYAGFLWMTAGGEEDKVSRAKKLISNGVIGLAIIMTAYSITYFVFRTILGSAASYGNPFGYGSTSNVTNYGPDPSNYEWYTGQ
ncbi:MAG: Uncharacterized protein G01um101413_948 [Parcubacteria group bacterium Gr01-1014_13]|nr:MAG: Uncharacterized protein G01um101413_948 [Parcubacteria group bacterium Gr01-1014_13]